MGGDQRLSGIADIDGIFNIGRQWPLSGLGYNVSPFLARLFHTQD